MMKVVDEPEPMMMLFAFWFTVAAPAGMATPMATAATAVAQSAPRVAIRLQSLVPLLKSLIMAAPPDVFSIPFGKVAIREPAERSGRATN